MSAAATDDELLEPIEVVCERAAHRFAAEFVHDLCPHCGAGWTHTRQSYLEAVAVLEAREADEVRRLADTGPTVEALAERFAAEELIDIKIEVARPMLVMRECGADDEAATLQRWHDAAGAASELAVTRVARRLSPTGERPEARSRLVDGGSSVLDAPEATEARWGQGDEVLWPVGEPLVIAAPPGTGKTTVAVQLVAAMAGIGTSDVLGYPVMPARRVLYLAMDRPRQIQRAMRRVVREEHRRELDERLAIWQGPPPQDLAADPHALEVLAANAGADVVVVDSLKDAAVKLSDDEVGGKVNRAIQNAVTAGIDVLVLHHQRKGQHGSKPTTLEDVYGSTWITAGAGSVVLLWGQAGDLVVELTHLKQPAETVGPLRILHDHTAGTSTVVDGVDLVALAAGTEYGVTVRDAARAIYEKDDPTRNEVEKARRRLERLVDAGMLAKGTAPRLDGGTPPTVYRTLVDDLVSGVEGCHGGVTQGVLP